MTKQYRKQLRTIILFEGGVLLIAILFVISFWGLVCDGGLSACIHQDFSFSKFLALSMMRPFVLTPLLVTAYMAGNVYGSFGGALLTAIGASLSCVAVLLIAKRVGRRWVTPWLASNLPHTAAFLRSQDWKIILAARLIPFFPFDLLTVFFGVLNFRWKQVLLFTFLGVIPEAYIYTEIANPNATFLGSTFTTVTMFCLFFLLPGIVIEFVYRKKGSGLWVQLKATWKEIHHEIQLNNTIVKRQVHNPKKLPVFLIYGFFSSRKSLTILERILTFRGYEVFSFNLGGLLGIFFTKSITESAEFVDYKLRRHFEKHHFDQIQIVAHSKGGLLALWWLLKMGGDKHCRKLITMGTPFQGSHYTWLGIVSPIGMILKDLWQMRPGSSFLKELNECEIPKDLTMHTLYSQRDTVARGNIGLFQAGKADPERVHYVPMHHVSHFDFLGRRDVGEVLTRILGSPYIEDHPDREGVATCKIDDP